MNLIRALRITRRDVLIGFGAFTLGKMSTGIFNDLDVPWLDAAVSAAVFTVIMYTLHRMSDENVSEDGREDERTGT